MERSISESVISQYFWIVKLGGGTYDKMLGNTALEEKIKTS